jgi:hypothetical protein
LVCERLIPIRRTNLGSPAELLSKVAYAVRIDKCKVFEPTGCVRRRVLGEVLRGVPGMDLVSMNRDLIEQMLGATDTR